MLRNTSIDAVIPLTTKLTNANALVEAMPQTPLHEAVAACYHPTLDANSQFTRVDDLSIFMVRERLLDGSNSKDLSGTVPHNVVMGKMVEVVAKTVQGNLQFARNVVNPLVKEVVNDVDKAVTDANVSSVKLLSVVPAFYHDIWNSPVLESMVSPYGDAAVKAFKSLNIHPAMTPEESVELLSAGNARFDKEVADWAGKLGADKVADIYATYFSTTGRGDSQMIELIGNPANRETVLAIHLFARKLKTKVLDGIDMDIGDYREEMTTIVEQTGRALVRAMERRAREARQKSLVVAMPEVRPEYVTAENGQIIVNGDTYNEWLAAGGTPEILFGAYLSEGGYGYQELLDKGKEYADIWIRQSKLLQARFEADVAGVKIRALRDAVARQINAIKDEDLVVARAVLHTRLTEHLDSINNGRLNDLPGLSRWLLCNVMFAHTDAEKILVAIDDVSRANPEMDMREAALHATIQFVTAWVAKLFKVTISYQ